MKDSGKRNSLWVTPPLFIISPAKINRGSESREVPVTPFTTLVATLEKLRAGSTRMYISDDPNMVTATGAPSTIRTTKEISNTNSATNKNLHSFSCAVLPSFSIFEALSLYHISD